jgi:type II secretory pathway pseudopilin PulG
MKRGQGGFTIVEALIYLAISGALFTIAFFGTRGTQDNVAFRASINAAELKIREVFNNVDNGYFGNDGNLTCAAVAPNYKVTISNAPSLAGTNGDCVFLGKQLAFNVGTPLTFQIDTMIASRQANEPLVAGSTLVLPSELSLTYTINSGVEYYKSYVNNGTPPYTSLNSVKITAERGRNMNNILLPSQEDLRASRYFYDSSGAKVLINQSALPVLCFRMDNRKGAITITPNDIIVDYVGASCP